MSISNISGTSFLRKRNKNLIFKGTNLTSNALEACEILLIKPESLMPKKLKEFYEKGMIESVQKLRYSHYESRRRMKIALVAEFILKRGHRRRCKTPDNRKYLRTNNYYNVLNPDFTSKKTNNEITWNLRSFESFKESAKSDLKLTRSVVHPFNQTNRNDKSALTLTLTKKKVFKKEEIKQQLDLNKQKLIEMMEKRNKKIADINQCKRKLTYDMIHNSKIMNEKARAFFDEKMKGKIKSYSNYQMLAKKSAENRINEEKIKSLENYNENIIIDKKLTEFNEKIQEKKQCYISMIEEKKDKIINYNQMRNDKRKSLFHNQSKNEADSIDNILIKMYKHKIKIEHKTKDREEELLYFKAKAKQKFEKVGNNKNNIKNEEIKKIENLENNFKTISKAQIIKEQQIKEITILKKEHEKLRKQDQLENLEREMAFSIKHRIEAASKIKETLNRTQKSRYKNKLNYTIS